MEAEHIQVPLDNAENEEENSESDNENEKKEKPVKEERGGKKEEILSQEKPRIQPHSWPKPQNRPLPQQIQNSHPFQTDLSNQGYSQDGRKSVTFGPAIRKDIHPENRPPIPQGAVIRRPSPWAVLRAKLPGGENLPVLRPGISNEYFIQRMQNPEAINRPPSRPPLSRPGSQESVRPPYIQRNDSVVGRPPSSPRPSASPIRPPSQSSTSSKDEDDVTINEVKGIQSSMSRPSSGQKNSGQQNLMPTVAQSPIIQIASHPQNMQTPIQMLNQPPRIQQSTNPPTAPTLVQNNSVLPQNHASLLQMTAPPLSQTQPSPPQNLTQTSPNKPQVIPPNQAPGPPSQVQGSGSQNLSSQQPQNTVQPYLKSPQQLQQSQLSQNQTMVAPTPQVQTSTNNLAVLPGQTPGPNSLAAINQNLQQNTSPNSGSQTPSPTSTALNSEQNSVPASPIGPKKPTPALTTNPTPLISKSSHLQKLEGVTLVKEENKISQESEPAPKTKMTRDEINQNDTFKEQKKMETSSQLRAEKQLHKLPIVVDATLKRPMDFIGPSSGEKAEETDKTAKDNEPPRPENSKKDSSPTKVQESTVINGNHESPQKSKATPPKKLGTAQSPLKSPNKPLPKTPETPGTADKKKVPMNKVQVGAAPSPNLKCVKSKIGSLENAKHKPGGGHIKIEHRKLNFNVAPKIAAKNDTYSPGGGDKKIQQVKLQWNAKPKVGSLENAAHKPGGGVKKIESVKLDFKEKAKPKVGSKDNIKHVAGGGTVKNSEEHLDGNQSEIEDQKLDIKAQSKVGSLDNVKHKPGGGDKKIFDDKEYIKQMVSTSTDSLNQERKKRSRCNSTSSQDSKYRSEEKSSSRLSLKSELQKDSKQKSPQRPTDQNSNQVNDKNMPEFHLKNTNIEQYNCESSTTQIKTNGINYQGVKKDANGNGKVQDFVIDDITEMKKKTQINEVKENQNLSTIALHNKHPPAIPISSLGDKKPPSKPKCQSYDNDGIFQNKDLTFNISSIETEKDANQGKANVSSNMPRPQPQISSLNQNPQKNANNHMATGLITDTLVNEGNGIIEKSLIEKTEKEINRHPDVRGQNNY